MRGAFFFCNMKGQVSETCLHNGAVLSSGSLFYFTSGVPLFLRPVTSGILYLPFRGCRVEGSTAYPSRPLNPAHPRQTLWHRPHASAAHKCLCQVRILLKPAFLQVSHWTGPDLDCPLRMQRADDFGKAGV